MDGIESDFATPSRGVAHAKGAPRAGAGRASLCEALDRVLDTGAVAAGDIVISVAGVDLIYLGVNLVLASVETMREWDADSRARKG